MANNMDELIEKGFDPKVFDNYCKLTLLMLRHCEDTSIQIQEYLQQFGLETVSIKNALEGMQGRLSKIAGKIKPKKTKDNILDYMREYELFVEHVNKFVDERK